MLMLMLLFFSITHNNLPSLKNQKFTVQIKTQSTIRTQYLIVHTNASKTQP